LLAAGGLLYLLSERATALMSNARLNRGLPGWIALSLYLVLSVSTTSLLASNPALLQISYALGCGVGLFVLANVTSGQSNSLVNLLEWPSITLLGRLSYSIYLVNDYVPSDIPQRILMLAARWSAGDAGQRTFEAYPYFSLFLSIVGVLLCFAIVVGAAFMSWTYVEKPALALRDRISGRPKFAWPSIKPAGTRNPLVSAASDR
jgi:peptidoglycan/LPS O-acetylase OafA/YrhL